MKKWCTFILCFIVTAQIAHAQYYRRDQAFMLGINAGYLYPTGDMGKILKNGLGGNFSMKYLVNRVVGIGFEAGYYSFKSKIAEGRAYDMQDYKGRVIPALIEATFYVPTWNRATLPYMGLHFGAYINNVKVSSTDAYYPENSHSKQLFIFSPGGGLHGGVLCELSDKAWLDIKIRADYVPKINDEYHFKEDDLNKHSIGFQKMLNIGANIGLLYKF